MLTLHRRVATMWPVRPDQARPQVRPDQARPGQALPQVLPDQATCRIRFSERCDHADVQAHPGATWLQQEHGRAVVRVNEPGEHCGAAADAAWSTTPGATLHIRTADCVPIALYGASPSEAAIAAIHAGWKGLLAGVIQATAANMQAAGVSGLRAIIGPHIHAASYEFGQSDLAELVKRYGPQVAATTDQGTPALDLGAATQAALAQSGIALDYDLRCCTAANGERYFSHRARGETERMTMSVELLTEPAL